MADSFESIKTEEVTGQAINQLNILESKEYIDAQGEIKVPIGKNENGKVIVRDLDDIPHILVTGTTGSGKTSFIQMLIAVVCKTCSPKKVKFAIYDAKGVEYTPFSEVSHLFVPVITYRHKAIETIKDLALESKCRLKELACFGCKDIRSYNEQVGKDDRKPALFFVIDDFYSLNLSKEELTDFYSIINNGRLTGIHVIVATSIATSKMLEKELISNVPCKVCFKLPTKVESKLVLEMAGAENLHIPGELIFKYQNDLFKVQGAYSTFENIRTAMSAIPAAIPNAASLQKMAESLFDTVQLPLKKNDAKSKKYTNKPDEYLYEAGRLIIEKDKASIGLIQRAYKIGFNRANDIMNQLADLGVVSEEDGNKPRQMLMTANEAEKLFCDEDKVLALLNGGDNKKQAVSKKKKEDEEKEEIKVKLRDYLEFEVDGISLSVKNNQISYSKAVNTPKGPGHLRAQFGGDKITRIKYRKPTLFSKGYFTFCFQKDASITNMAPDLLHADSSNVSEIIKAEFGISANQKMLSFIIQISEDIGVKIEQG